MYEDIFRKKKNQGGPEICLKCLCHGFKTIPAIIKCNVAYLGEQFGVFFNFRYYNTQHISRKELYVTAELLVFANFNKAVQFFSKIYIFLYSHEFHHYIELFVIKGLTIARRKIGVL